MGLTQDMLRRIKEEIINDPDNLGYAGKTDLQIADLLSNGFTTTMTEISVITHISPINKVLAFLAESPNVISSVEVSQAKIIT